VNIYETREGVRLQMNQQRDGHWNRWGPYVAERAWGTVREDYSKDGDAWSYFPHDHARSRAYRWNEDGIAGICDRHQYLCFALAFWNTRDPILKERMFGLNAHEGNHGEDVKEYYFYLDNTPTHSYMKYLYKYPQAAYPYEQLLEANRSRGRFDGEYELVDTGIFDQSRYFDVAVEYAKLAPEDILVRINITNRGPEKAPIHALPTLWFRNTWTWGRDDRLPSLSAPAQSPSKDSRVRCVMAQHWQLGKYLLYCSGTDELLFTENETNYQRLFGTASRTRYVKDAFHSYVIDRKLDAVNPAQTGTKAAAHYYREVGPGETVTLQLRLAAMVDDHPFDDPFADFDANFQCRKEDADQFYAVVLPPALSDDAKLIARQAFAGMLWSKQYYHYVMTDWLYGDPAQPAPPPERLHGRNSDWLHFFTRDVLSVPDKWEFPWFASWDLGFHCIMLAYVDPQYAKEQILLMLREWYTHPNGQIPAYEWNFGDVNPPVLSMAAQAVFEVEKQRTGVADYTFLERVFQKMLLNFTWWVNRKDALGKNVFQGGFLGMDNIGAFDRDNMPPGYLLGQADGTSWMAAFAKNLLSIALTLAERDPVYEDLASKFWEHYIYIADSMNNPIDSEKSLWDSQDGFFYDYLMTQRGERFPVRARTMVGFVPIFGGTTVAADTFDRYPDFQRRRQWFIDHRPDLIASIQPMVTPGEDKNLLLGFVRQDQLRSLLRYMLDENEFFSPYGVRAVSRYHRDHPLVLHLAGQEYRLDYEPGESTTELFGGNSNWRGPIWIPVNQLILLSLRHYHRYYGDAFKMECPTGSGNQMTLKEISRELARRICHLFLRGEDGNRPVFGGNALFNNDPHWRDLIPFYEYFHGDTGRGCGASHQTGWSGLIGQILIDRGELASGNPFTAEDEGL
jgi:Glycosyl hydrolase family 63 C-terminal domain